MSYHILQVKLVIEKIVIIFYPKRKIILHISFTKQLQQYIAQVLHKCFIDHSSNKNYSAVPWRIWLTFTENNTVLGSVGDLCSMSIGRIVCETLFVWRSQTFKCSGKNHKEGDKSKHNSARNFQPERIAQLILVLHGHPIQAESVCVENSHCSICQHCCNQNQCTCCIVLVIQVGKFLCRCDTNPQWSSNQQKLFVIYG